MGKTKKIINAGIISNKRVAPDHFVMEVGSAFLAKNSSPGQFVLVKAQAGATDPLFKVPLGVHVIKRTGIKLLYKAVGPKTVILSRKKKGESIEILGPLGNGFDLTPILKQKDSRVVIIAGGHGIAPLFGLTEAIVKKKRHVDFFLGAREKKHILCAKELKQLGAAVHIATECGTAGDKGYVTGPARRHFRNAAQDVICGSIYACGPRPMLSALYGDLKDYNIPMQFSLDAYMACGIGACLGCAVKTVTGYKMVCKDGPVFDASEILWETQDRRPRT